MLRGKSTTTKKLLFLQSEVETLISISSSDQAFVENLSQLMEQLESKETDLDEKYRLRFRLLTEVQRIVRRLDLYPGGISKTPEQLSILTIELQEMGYPENTVSNYISQTQTKPDRKARFFVAHMRNGVKRAVVHDKVLETNPH